MLDTIRAIETPEGIELNLHLSGPVPRMLGWLIDIFIRIGIYIVLASVLTWLGDFGSGLYLILFFLIEWFYPVVFEVYFDGMTPGKRAMGIRVVHDDGTPVGWAASIIRNFLRFVDFLPLFYAFGLISMLLNSEFRRLGDIVAGTVVIYREEQKKHPDMPDVSEFAPAWSLHSDEAQSVVSFAERAGQLSEDRADELARTTGLLIPPSRPPAMTLRGIAKWIIGG
ncbi:MAG: RDD family protein [Gammaproteobacteria bacterium]|nr:MAG: RDD family protein [Gammaproteobacteria bacterium]